MGAAQVGVVQLPRAGGGVGYGGACPPARRGPLLALSPRGQALQGKQKSVVNTVPNPKWLLPELQSNKSATCLFIILGAFYHSADGCYLRKAQQLAASRPPRKA